MTLAKEATCLRRARRADQRRSERSPRYGLLGPRSAVCQRGTTPRACIACGATPGEISPGPNCCWPRKGASRPQPKLFDRRAGRQAVLDPRRRCQAAQVGTRLDAHDPGEPRLRQFAGRGTSRPLRSRHRQRGNHRHRPAHPFGIAFNTDGEMFTYDADAEFDMGGASLVSTDPRQPFDPGSDFGWRAVTGASPLLRPIILTTAPAASTIGRGSPTALMFGTPGAISRAPLPRGPVHARLGLWANSRGPLSAARR